MRLLEGFILRALFAGIGFAVIAGPMGCFVVWRRLAFFGDTLAHASLCGLAFAILMDMDPLIGTFLICFVISLGFAQFKSRFALPSDTILAVISHGSLAIGILCLSFLKGMRIDLNAYLFGDILSLNSQDLWVIVGGGVIIFAGLSYIWHGLLSVTLAEDLAAVEGIAIHRINLIYMFLLGLFVAFSIKMVGALLITALLLLPASTAQAFAKSPEQMAIFSSAIGALMVTGGVMVSNFYDIPTAPAIVVVGLFLFLGVNLRVIRS